MGNVSITVYLDSVPGELQLLIYTCFSVEHIVVLGSLKHFTYHHKIIQTTEKLKIYKELAVYGINIVLHMKYVKILPDIFQLH